MPYDDATIGTSALAGGEFIWACAGPRIFKINPSTGEVVSSAIVDTKRFQSTVAYNPTDDVVFMIGYSVQWSESTILFTNNYPCNLYEINPNTLTISNTTQLTSLAGFSTGYDLTTGACIGARRCLWADGLLGGTLFMNWHYNEFGILARYRAAGYIRSIAGIGGKTNGFADIDWNGSDRVFWSDTFFQTVYVFDATTNGFVWNSDADYDLWTDDTNIPFGLGVLPPSDPNDQNFFVGTQNGIVKRLSYNSGASTISLVGNINTGLSGIIFRVIYNPYDGMMYCPMASQNKVVIIDPSDNSVTVNSGTFDVPWGVVFTGAGSGNKKWVVQQGAVGLKELT